MNDFDRFKMAASQIVGKRLTWKQAIGMQESAVGRTEKERSAKGAGNERAVKLCA